MKAWIENNRIRDIAHDDPYAIYHPGIAQFYDTEVPSEAKNGDEWINGQLIKPQSPTPVLKPEPIRTWGVSDVRNQLTMAERVSWDNDKTPEIKTAKIEFAKPKELAYTTEVLQLLVDSNSISQESMNKILA